MITTTTYLKRGDIIPTFELLNFDGKRKKLADYLGKGKLIVSFYRGDWCPYCNLEVKALQDNIDNFRAKGADLIAISPQMPDYGLLFKEKHKLNFDVLSDLGNAFARKNGLEVLVSSEQANMLKEKTSFTEQAYQQRNGQIVFPIPATYVIDRTGKVIYSFVDLDFSKRASVENILSVL